MGDELPKSLLEALVVGEFVAEHPDLTERNLMPMLATAGEVDLGRLAGYSRVYTRRHYLGDLKKVGAYILTRKIGSTNLSATNVVGVLDHTTVARHADYIEGMRERYITNIRMLLETKRPILEARLSEWKHTGYKHTNPNSPYSSEELDTLRSEFSLYCRRARTDELKGLSPKEKIWLRALLLYKTLEDVEGLDEPNVLPLIASISSIPIKDIRSDDRHVPVSSVRQVACYIFRNLLKEKAPSYPEIGRLVGGKDHSTVITACRNVKKRLEANRELLRYIMEGGSLDPEVLRPATTEDNYKIVNGHTNRKFEEAAALAKSLMEIKGLSPENILGEACRIAGINTQDVKFGYSNRKSLSVKRAVSYIGSVHLRIKLEDLAEILGYDSISSIVNHSHALIDKFSGE